jgi:hypothetical protein
MLLDLVKNIHIQFHKKKKIHNRNILMCPLYRLNVEIHETDTVIRSSYI